MSPDEPGGPTATVERPQPQEDISAMLARSRRQRAEKAERLAARIAKREQMSSVVKPIPEGLEKWIVEMLEGQKDLAIRNELIGGINDENEREHIISILRSAADVGKNTIVIGDNGELRPISDAEIVAEIEKGRIPVSQEERRIDPVARAAARKADDEYVAALREVVNAESEEKVTGAAGQPITEEGQLETLIEERAEEDERVTREERLEDFGKISRPGYVFDAVAELRDFLGEDVEELSRLDEEIGELDAKITTSEGNIRESRFSVSQLEKKLQRTSSVPGIPRTGFGITTGRVLGNPSEGISKDQQLLLDERKKLVAEQEIKKALILTREELERRRESILDNARRKKREQEGQKAAD